MSKGHFWKGAKFAGSVGHPMTKMLSASEGLRPPDPLTSGSAPGPRWGLYPQTPVIRSCSALAMVPPPTTDPFRRLCVHPTCTQLSVQHQPRQLRHGTDRRRITLFENAPRATALVHACSFTCKLTADAEAYLELNRRRAGLPHFLQNNRIHQTSPPMLHPLSQFGHASHSLTYA